MNKQQALDLMVSVMFERNDFETSEQLINAIKQAASIPDAEWRTKKQAFNSIGEKAPLSDEAGFCLRYEDVPECIDRWVAKLCGVSLTDKAAN